MSSSSRDFEGNLGARLRAAQHQTTEEISALQFEYARAVARAVSTFVEECDEDDAAQKIDLVVLSGQTVCHKPGPLKKEAGNDKQMNSNEGQEFHTFQLGDGNVLSALTQLPVLWNLRTTDVALG